MNCKDKKGVWRLTFQNDEMKSCCKDYIQRAEDLFEPAKKSK